MKIYLQFLTEYNKFITNLYLKSRKIKQYKVNNRQDNETAYFLNEEMKKNKKLITFKTIKISLKHET